MSLRAIGRAIGVDQRTVGRQLRQNAAVELPDKVRGLDGREAIDADDPAAQALLFRFVHQHRAAEAGTPTPMAIGVLVLASVVSDQ